MMYLATFHTHLAALRTFRAMEREGLSCRMAPVPRRISSSCGTCLFYEAPDPCLALLDRDTEALWLPREDPPRCIREFE